MLHNTADFDELEIARIFAPELRLHSEELYFPASVEWYIKKCQLRFSTGKCDLDPIILNSIENFDQLLGQSFVFQNKKYYSMMTEKSNEKSNFYLQVKDQIAIFGEPNNLEKVPVYVRFFYSENSSYFDIQYYFFYGYNGNLKSYLPTVGIHEGDWEHITVRVKTGLNYSWENIIAIYYSAHGGEGRWYLNCAGIEGNSNFIPSATVRGTQDMGTGIGYHLNSEFHPIVYSSKYLHASYPTPRRQRRFVPFGLIDDYTDDKGYFWKTWKTITLLPETSKIFHLSKNIYSEDSFQYFESKFENQDLRWLLFNGMWGRKGKKNLGESDGPYGPGMKAYFRNGDIGISINNSIGYSPINSNNFNIKNCSIKSCAFDHDSLFEDSEELSFELKVFKSNFSGEDF